MKKITITYEILMLILVIVSLLFAFLENEQIVLYDRIIWIIFVIDYTVRFLRSENKWAYVKKHPLELVAINRES
ncbi:hypothetical protein I2483_18755 [Sporosarcina sp. E16_3]|uniref:hypothetical protein n=1 Tax=Sporosarcina sp. E16_3 TaxID=2789293 RepID=UPI001A90DAE4|nr:hypothetical protein [Sporosarcina sp. E16_3]MBO0603707.1 hypothetical protein [Sporosarcina sp. E16_3]